MVTIQTEEGIKKDLMEKMEIEEAIMKNNQAKYQQSFHTPFMRSPLKVDFGFKGITTAAQAALVGVYDLTDQGVRGHLFGRGGEFPEKECAADLDRAKAREQLEQVVLT